MAVLEFVGIKLEFANKLFLKEKSIKLCKDSNLIGSNNKTNYMRLSKGDSVKQIQLPARSEERRVGKEC